MFFIFGWGRQTVKNHGPVNVYHSNRCNNNGNWVLYSRKTWFTLFFIPVIPYSSEYLMLCPVCNHGVTLDKVKFDELKAASANQSGSSFYDENTMTGKTETQKNYIRQMKELEQERNKDQSVSGAPEEQ